MRIHRTLLIGASIAAVLAAVACGDDEGGDDGSTGGTGNEGGEDPGGSGGTNAGRGGTGNGGSGNVGNGGSGNVGNESGAGGVDQGGSGGVDQGGAGNAAGSGGNGEGGAGPVACDLDATEDGGLLSGVLDDTTLESGKSYTLVGNVKVPAGVTLTVEPCTKIFGDFQTKGTLIVLPGGKLEASGTADSPIVFTSEKAAGQRAAGDWGGIIILGNGVNNDATATSKVEIEGLLDGTKFGNVPAAAANAESSGSLEYVRIEYPGIDLDGMGNEINGLTLGAVGSGTSVSHVMVSNSLDDCFEWFGGAVNADHLICNNPGDDMFDADSGYFGKVQFVFGRQGATITTDPNGFEWDNDQTMSAKAPVTDPTFSNVTLCGNKDTAETDAHVGMVLRRGTHGSISNAIITGFPRAAFSIRNPNLVTADLGTLIGLTHSLIFENATTFDAANEVGATWFSGQEGNSSAAPEDFGDCWANPPAPFPAAEILGGTPPAGLDRTAEFVGAFADAGDNWMTGAWVDWSED